MYLIFFGDHVPLKSYTAAVDVHAQMPSIWNAPMQESMNACHAGRQHFSQPPEKVGMDAILNKTPEGQQAFKARSAPLAGKLRSAFLLFDGQRSVQDVLHATQGLGVALADIDLLLQAGLLQAMPSEESLAEHPVRTPQERYRDAYPVAAALTGKLGLVGFRLHLAVEAATSYEALAAVAPKIKDAIGASAYAPLEQALFA